MGIAGALWRATPGQPSRSNRSCRGAMGIAGGRGAWKPESRPRFLPQSRPVDGHSVLTGALHALFSAAARQQSSGRPSRPPASRTSSRPRPRLGARKAAQLGRDSGEDVRKGRRERPAPQDDARALQISWMQGLRLPFCRFLRMLGSLHGNRRFGTGRHVLRMIVLLRARGTVLLWH
jgi:hypothetical protein